MSDLPEAKKRAIDFLLDSIKQPWGLEPHDNDPLRFEAFVYLANKGIISKSEWGGKIKNIWDSWIDNKACSQPSRRWFWPAKKEKVFIDEFRDEWLATREPLAPLVEEGVNAPPENVSVQGDRMVPGREFTDVCDPSIHISQSSFIIENHLSMFRTREVFSIPGYSEAFEQVKKVLRKILRDLHVDPYDEGKRLVWQIMRSPFLRKALKNSLLAAQVIIEENMDVDESIFGILPENIFFNLCANLEDDHFRIAKSFLNKEISKQSKNGSFFEDEIKTCLFICSIHLSGIDPNGIISNPAIAWLENVQKENGRWQFESRYKDSRNLINKQEDTFVTVLVLETLDLISNNKPLPIWAENVIPTQPSSKGSHSISHLLNIPTGIKWGDVSITFISEESVEIRAKKPLGVKNFIELGFDDKRTKNPNFQWKILISLAHNSGSITWGDKSAAPKMKSHIKILRNRLRGLFEIDEDPFFRYSRSTGYKTKFRVAFREEN